MATTTLETRTTTISARKVAQVGPEYTRTWVGLPVVFTTYEGDRLVGVLEWADYAHYPIVRFPDGRWARLDYTIEVVR